MLFNRRFYLQKLINAQGNGMVKIITGIRRCGKSYLLFNIFRKYLLDNGITDDHIISISLDDLHADSLLNPKKLLSYIESNVHDDKQKYYVIIDEIQLVPQFVELLLTLMHHPQLEVYVSGSNSKFLSSDVVTEFRGRGWEIRIHPLSFAEYYESAGGDKMEALQTYYTYGGLPQVYSLPTDIGASTNPKRISNTFDSVSDIAIKETTIDRYIQHLQDAFIINESMRYNVKGRKYIGTENKYFFEDIGLRNAIINFRQTEFNHIMENVIYNELRMRGYSVDVGMVEVYEKGENNKTIRKKLEVDFVVNKGSKRIYIQSAYALPDAEKVQQEQRSLLNIPDSFQKIIITGDYRRSNFNEEGVLFIGIFDFLLDINSVTKL